MTSEILVPFINANDDVVELEQWYVKDGQLIQKEQQVAELATSKVNVVVLSEVNGFVKTLCKAGDRLPVGSPVALLFSEWAEYENYIESHVAKFETVSANNFAPSVGSHGFSRFSESAVEFIQSQGLDPDRFAGMGLVTSQTVKNFINPAPMQSDAQNAEMQIIGR